MSLDFALIFDRSPTPTMVLNADLEYVAVNPAYLEMVGKSREEVMHRYVFDVFPETEERVDAMTAVFRDVLAGNEADFNEVPFRLSRDGVEAEQFWTARHVPVPNSSGEIKYFVQYSENVTDKVRMRELQNSVMAEQQHRIGNLFSIVTAVARQTARTSETVDEFLPRFQERVTAMVDVNRSLLGGTMGAAEFGGIIEHQLAVFPEDVRERISCEGTAVHLSTLQAKAISMAIHELGTNSMKYGAIGNAEGRVDISWGDLPGGQIEFQWRETNLLSEQSSEGTGYGSMLLSTIIPRQLAGMARREIENDSFVYHLVFSAGQEQPAADKPSVWHGEGTEEVRAGAN
ncbi:HWE histidine kinase domain-containing protein [Hoeflea sp.]|uniref:HWE histidine kinase domain-containing protein n=1 Tax=Hoeflea sp. TaxID=1940281 RepID=UPI003B519569